MTGEKIVVRKNSERNYGIDMLRLVSMFMVVILHVLGRGGVLEATTRYSANYGLAWFLEIACYCAVNCYALISGYVGVCSKHKWSSLVYLWLQVEFYMIIFTAMFSIFQPGSIGIAELLKMVFPVVFYQYWYFTAYFCMFFFIPVLNLIVQTLEKKTLIFITGSIFLLFSVAQTLRYAEIFGTGGVQRHFGLPCYI